jgi:ring-1,2-phenylacetyl-CoA epoxidase subunit PaaC
MAEDEFTAYHSLGEDSEDHRWAFGTGFTDPLEGIDTSVPEETDPTALAAYCLALGDDALIYSHRLQEWLTRMPELEEETALANIALDLLGQARMLLARAAKADPSCGADEDALAFLRESKQFRNVRLVERHDDDFAELVARLLVFATWRLALFTRLSASGDPVLAAIAAKGAKELAYHRDYAGQWVVRLGDGTDESRGRIQRALHGLWPLVGELFVATGVERALPGTAVDPTLVQPESDAVIDTVLATAGLDRPDAAPLGTLAGLAGRDGMHTEALGYVLAELQSVARAHPDATW